MNKPDFQGSEQLLPSQNNEGTIHTPIHAKQDGKRQYRPLQESDIQANLMQRQSNLSRKKECHSVECSHSTNRRWWIKYHKFLLIKRSPIH